MNQKFSYSRVGCFNQCPYLYKLRYIDEFKTIPSDDPADPLIVGSALHKAIESGIDAAREYYFSQYPIIGDAHIHEFMKIEVLAPKVVKILPKGTHEVKIETNNFVGYIDYLTEDSIFDYKYSNNVDRYLESGQLHIYKYFYELTHQGHVVDNLYFVFLPKTQIRQKKTETLLQFRKRLLATLSDMEVQVVKVDYNPEKVAQYLSDIQTIKSATEYPKNETRLCEWCSLKDFCRTQGEDTMAILPKNERRKLDTVSKKVIWLYGAPFSGKTTLANQFPDPLMLNTDGNFKLVDAAYIHIKDTVTVEGRLRKRKLAWDQFKEIVEELEAKQNTFKTIVIDLVEHMHDNCREWIFNENDIEHETDMPYGKGFSLVFKTFVSLMKKVINMDYENIILISHEDATKSFTNRQGASITTYRPNIQEKVANQLAGMVDLVGRVVVKDGVRTISFKTDEYTFGGGRIKVKNDEIPLDFNALMEVYNNATK